MTNHTDLIARLREVEAEQRKVAHGMDMDPKKTINWEHAETINAGIAALEAARAYVARLAELEKQEPVIYQAKTKPGFLSTSAYAWEDCEKADFLVYEADGVHVRGLYAAAGASLVATPIVAWAKSTPRKLRITTMDMGREDGWRPLGYTAAGASPVQPLTNTQIEKGMMALLWCAASDLGRLNPNMYEGYKDDVTRVYSAITTETTRN